MQTTLEETPQQPVNSGQEKPSEGLNAAQFLLKQLSEWGITRIYGVIGDAILYVLDEIAKQNRIRYVPCRHEGAAALMASAEAKLTGKPAVCLATSGPGMANLLNGLADAASDRAPVLAVTGQVESAKIGTRTKQYIDQQRLIDGITPHTELLAHPDAMPEVLARLLTTAVTAGTVAHLSVPKDMWLSAVNGKASPYPKHLHQRWVVPEETLAGAVKLLAAAERPLIYMGRGVEGAASEALELAVMLSASVVTTLPARPLFPNDHALYAGGLGQAGSESASILMAEADLILLLGGTWWPEDYAPAALQAKVVQVDAAKEQLGLGHPLDHGIAGDLREVLPRLKAALSCAGGHGGQPDRSLWYKRAVEVKEQWKTAIEAEASQEGSPVVPQRLMRALSGAVGPNAVITLDTGDHTLWFDRIFQAKPGQRILLSGRWRTLGFALPAAIAAQLAEPERQVLAVAGDGGSVQTLMEFLTAVELELPIVLVIIDNGSYAMEKNRLVLNGLSVSGSIIRNPDFVQIAEACGGTGFRAENPEQLEDALRRALTERKPALIQVRTADPKVPHTQI